MIQQLEFPIHNLFCDFSFFSVTRHVIKAFLISFISLTLSFASCTLVILGYLIDIFTKTGSSLSAKDSSLLISITQILANLVLLNILERINRRVSLFFPCQCQCQYTQYSIFENYILQTLYIGSSLLTMASFFPIRCLFDAVDWSACVRLDANILFGLYNFFQLVRTHSRSIRCNYGNIPKEGVQMKNSFQFFFLEYIFITSHSLHFRFSKYVSH